MAIRIDVGRFQLINTASPRRNEEMPCSAGIDGVRLSKFSYTVGGTTYEYPKVAGEDDITDPVRWLMRFGWSYGPMVGTGLGPGGEKDDETGQPAGFQRQEDFQSLHVEYTAPAHCDCTKDGKPESKRRIFKWTIDYDRNSNSGPRARLVEVDGGGAEKSPPDKQLSRPTVSQNPATDGFGRTTYDVTQDVTAFIPCPCDENDPCQVHFTLRYSYTPTAVPD